MWGFGKKVDLEPHEKFWRWFVKNDDMLLHFDRDRERVFDRLAAELQKVHPNLCFEFGPEEEKREFVISAGGIKEAFPAVVSLAEAAPVLARWRVTAFRPRRVSANIVEFAGKRVDPENVQFTLLQKGNLIGLNLFIPDCRDDDWDLKQIGYLLLDETLGEFDVEMGLGAIEMLAPEINRPGDRYPLSELAERFDELRTRIDGRSPKPH